MPHKDVSPPNLRSRMARFKADESGAATIEAVIWIPFFFFIMAMVLDASMMFNAQSRALRIVQDTNRALAVGRIATVADAETLLRTRIATISPSATVDAIIAGDLVTSSVRMPFGDLIMFNVFDSFGDFAISAQSQQLLED